MDSMIYRMPIYNKYFNYHRRLLTFILIFSTSGSHQIHSQSKARDLGVSFGIFQPGAFNAITDVVGVKVGHVNVIEGENIRTGVTAILPHENNVFEHKVPAAIYLGNGFGKLMGYSQVEELGNLETPIILTNTLSVPTAANALITHALANDQGQNIRSVNPIVGETNDGYLNDIRGRHVTEQHVLDAIESAQIGLVPEGNVGAGVGTICFGYKGGIGSSSRKLPESLGGYTIGVLVQSNFGGDLRIGGLSIGQLLGKYPYQKHVLAESDGSCMIVVATDAPVGARNLKRLAKRAFFRVGQNRGLCIEW